MFQQQKFTGGTKKTVQLIKKGMRDKISPERTLKLMHCLIEMNDTSLLEEVKIYMSSDSEHQLSPDQCSVLMYLLLISSAEIDEFDLRKYLKSDEGLRRMMPVVAVCRRALLSNCNLTKQSCTYLISYRMSYLTELDLSYNSLQDAGVSELAHWLKSPNSKLQILRLCRCDLRKKSCRGLHSVLSSNSSRLRELDMSYNKLQDSGVKLLSAGLENPHCTLEILRLSECRITDESCVALASALRSNSSSHLRELELKNNPIGESGVNLLSDLLNDPHCKLERLL
ncbi:ribonuclease inhibitor-like [Clarias gariepinus]